MSKTNVPEDLASFVDSAKKAGVADADLIGLLKQHGWSDKRAYAALSAYYVQRLGTIPERGGAIESARDAFLYLLAFVTLAIWTVALVWLANALTDWALPSAIDDMNRSAGFRQNVAGQLASLIVAFPIFMSVSAAIVRETFRRPESIESAVRKWLTYIALVITAVIMLGDAMWFLTQFLLGELTLRFAIKAFTVFVVSGGVMWYYLGSVSSDGRVRGRDAYFGWASTAIVSLALVLGFSGIGGPPHNRSVSVDDQRIGNLETLADQINTAYSAAHKHLPQTLASIPMNDRTGLYDPVSHRPYRYQPVSSNAYRLCATFDTIGGNGSNSFWEHPSGEHCFRIAADAPVPMAD